ncbi:hypothetical protein GOBAR_AA00957 [Gossypium barbadense]|uniref:Uncharacterized protein n=1 Tax=Gossypium barbadense TaxID=3634 RepID=A0A2P5YVI3_GOSBA|nr:hypothetical protein GOBAR_AA00957 [Gossypium barbadense]
MEGSFLAGCLNEEKPVSVTNPNFGPWMLVEMRSSRQEKWGNKTEAPANQNKVAIEAHREGNNEQKWVEKFGPKLQEPRKKANGRTKKVDIPKNIYLECAISQGNLVSNVQENNEAEDLENIKAYYNPIFDESEVFIVPISDNTLDPDRRGGGKDRGSQSSKRAYIALQGRGNRFKSSGTTRVPLAKSMETVAELLSPQILNECSNDEVDGARSKTDNNIGLNS